MVVREWPPAGTLPSTRAGHICHFEELLTRVCAEQGKRPQSSVFSPGCSAPGNNACFVQYQHSFHIMFGLLIYWNGRIKEAWRAFIVHRFAMTRISAFLLYLLLVFALPGYSTFESYTTENGGTGEAGTGITGLCGNLSRSRWSAAH